MTIRGSGATALLVLVGAGACAMLGIPTLPEGWTREELRLSMETLSPGSQHLRFATVAGQLELRGTVRRYSFQDVPGWDRPLVERVGSAAGGFLARQLGMATNDVVVNHGTISISEPGVDGWVLRCAVFWMLDQDVEHDRASGEDQVVAANGRTRGADCHGARVAQPDSTVWRLSYGIAPPLDSLAAMYDSLAAEASPAVSWDPPITLVRLAPDGSIGVNYEVQREQRWLRFNEADHQPLAVLHLGVDFAPDASMEEKVILRMIALALAESPGT